MAHLSFAEMEIEATTKMTTALAGSLTAPTALTWPPRGNTHWALKLDVEMTDCKTTNSEINYIDDSNLLHQDTFNVEQSQII